MNDLFKIDYPKSAINLQKLFVNEEAKNGSPLFKSEKVNELYGEVNFDDTNYDRPYTFTSLVHSIDGRIAFSDAPEGPFIASENKIDPDGGKIDFWILNVLRSQADGCIMGAGTLKAEASYTVHVFDPEIENERIAANLPDVPWNIITSVDGKDIVFDHMIFSQNDVPKMINTSPNGLEHVKQNCKSDFEILPEVKNDSDLSKYDDLTLDRSKLYVLVTDDNGYPNTTLYLKALKKLGINRLLIESPTLMHIFIQNKAMDELFFNCSSLYIGGKALTMGQHGVEFTSKDHPHTKVMSIHIHKQNFVYTRHKLVY